MSLGISDSSSGLDKSSDYIPYKTTVELGAERKIAQVKAKINVLSNLDKVNVKFENGFLKRKARVENYEDFIKELYVKGLRREEIYFALKDLEKIAEGELKEKIKTVRKEVGKKEGLYSKHVKAIAFLSIIASAAIGSYLIYKHLENQKKEEAKKPYKQAGLSDEQAEEFITKYPKQNGNSTWVSFAKSWANNRALAEESLKTFGNLKDSLEYLYFANSNGYDGLNFLKDFPQFAKNYEEVLPAYSANSTLVKTVYDQFQRDPRISFDRNDLFLEALKVYQNLGVKGLKRIDSVWLLNNASLLGFRDLEGLRKALEFSESSNISLNFEKRLVHSALADTGYYFPEIFKYPYEAKYLAIQVADTIYFVECVDGLNFSISDLKGKDYVWNGLVLPYCKWRFERLENKSFESLDYKFKEGELAKLAEWADASVVDAAARSLYPFEELMDHDLLGFDSTRFFHDRKILQALERGVRNMSFNSTINNSPFGYIYDLLESDMKEKNDRYVEAYSGFWSCPPHDIWINSSSFWKMKVGEYYQRTPESRALVEQDPETTIIRGYPPALSICDIPVNSHFYLAGQSDPYYSKIIGAMKNRAVVVLRAPYPTSPDGKHDEPFIVGKDGKLIGFWYKLDKFLDDYNPEKGCHFWVDSREYKVDDYWKTNKPWIKVEIISDLNSRKFEYQDLSKVLNP
jgi:hypothetical protein